MTEDMTKERPELSCGGKDGEKNFSEGISLEEANVSIGRIGRAIEKEEL
jgi:hypothetical protein